ncbi:hypothetical protein QJS10_CPA16g00525 [Acorus calamus]|uniref:Uncharacterized protein n=1 Tax=Acorus calamus TaxID=4465 RepID=A0AAV9D0P9_ACOCL|nr:hypothetical protein QJS10_CPA16g00525 [Acorus calamus]
MATRVPTSTFLIFFLSILVGTYCRSGLDSSELMATLDHDWKFNSGPPTKEIQFQAQQLRFVLTMNAEDANTNARLNKYQLMPMIPSTVLIVTYVFATGD